MCYSTTFITPHAQQWKCAHVEDYFPSSTQVFISSALPCPHLTCVSSSWLNMHIFCRRTHTHTDSHPFHYFRHTHTHPTEQSRSGLFISTAVLGGGMVVKWMVRCVCVAVSQSEGCSLARTLPCGSRPPEPRPERCPASGAFGVWNDLLVWKSFPLFNTAPVVNTVIF